MFVTFVMGHDFFTDFTLQSLFCAVSRNPVWIENKCKSDLNEAPAVSCFKLDILHSYDKSKQMAWHAKSVEGLEKISKIGLKDEVWQELWQTNPYNHILNVPVRLHFIIGGESLLTNVTSFLL